MVKVNLLRPELGKVKRVGSSVSLPRLRFGRLEKNIFLLALLFFILGVGLALHRLYLEKNFTQITNQYSKAAKARDEVSGLNKEKEKLNRQVYFLEGYLKREIIWSQKLEQMRNLIPPEVWLKKFSYEAKPAQDKYGGPYLYLSGGLTPTKQTSAIGILSNFINQLKENKDFSRDFENPILSDVKTEVSNNVGVMSFVIEMPLGKGKRSTGAEGK